MNAASPNRRRLTDILLGVVAVLLLLNLFGQHARPQAQSVGVSESAQREIAQATLEVARANERAATALREIAVAISNLKLELPESSQQQAAPAAAPGMAAPAAGGGVAPAQGGGFEGTFELGR